MIKTEEKRIRKLMNDNEKARRAFEKMRSYYEIMDKLQTSTHLVLLNKIYLEKNDNHNNIKLAMLASVTDRTCYRYRVQYVECFYICLSMMLA